MNRRKVEKEWQDFVDTPVEISYKKDEGKEHGGIMVKGSQIGVLTGLTELLHRMLENEVIDMNYLDHAKELLKGMDERNESK